MATDSSNEVADHFVIAPLVGLPLVVFADADTEDAKREDECG